MKLTFALLIFGILALSNCDLAKAEMDKYRDKPKPLKGFQELFPLGTTREEVVALIGSPNFESKANGFELWAYYGIVLNPITGNKNILYLSFSLEGKLIRVYE